MDNRLRCGKVGGCGEKEGGESEDSGTITLVLILLVTLQTQKHLVAFPGRRVGGRSIHSSASCLVKLIPLTGSRTNISNIQRAVTKNSGVERRVVSYPCHTKKPSNTAGRRPRVVVQTDENG